MNPNRVYIVAELSANHGGSLARALELVGLAADAGADAVKLQTYTADTLTIDCDNEHFRISGGTAWDGRTLYDLYQEASMPWEWHPELMRAAASRGLDCFSSPFDASSVDFLEELGVERYKLASFELVDVQLLRKIASTGKSVIMSTGMATAEEIQFAVSTLREGGSRDITLLKCTSAYPADPADANLRTMTDMVERFGCPVGLSDHTLGISVPVAAVALGACMIEKHFTASRAEAGPDAGFSLEPPEFAEMVAAVRVAEVALGRVRYGGTEAEEKSRAFRRSLFVVKDMRRGDVFSADNVRSIRPGYGLSPRHYDELLGRKARQDISRGTPLNWDLVD